MLKLSERELSAVHILENERWVERRSHFANERWVERRSLFGERTNALLVQDSEISYCAL